VTTLYFNKGGAYAVGPGGVIDKGALEMTRAAAPAEIAPPRRAATFEFGVPSAGLDSEQFVSDGRIQITIGQPEGRHRRHRRR
jgi:hypothetical protein